MSYRGIICITLFVNDLNKDICIIIVALLVRSTIFSLDNSSTISKKIFTRYTSLVEGIFSDYHHSAQICG